MISVLSVMSLGRIPLSGVMAVTGLYGRPFGLL